MSQPNSTDNTVKEVPEEGWTTSGTWWESNDVRQPWRMTAQVISYEDGTLVVDQKMMIVGLPYGAIFESVPVVAIKRESGEVDFYYIDQK